MPDAALLLVGCGKMGGALLAGWIDRGVAPDCITVVEPNETAARSLVAEAGTSAKSAATLTVLGDIAEIDANSRPDAVIFAVKPQVLDAVVPPYRRFVAPETVFLSIAAGKTLAGFARHLGETAAVVRAMPNTPAAVRRGISVACANENTTAAQRETATRLLAAVGEVAWVEDEALLDPVTAVSGSGPAYLFLLTECLAEAGVAAGLSEDLAMRLARATVAGSGELMRQSADSPSELRRNVTSPGGTTEAALEILMGAAGLAPLMAKAVAAATARSRQLAE